MKRKPESEWDCLSIEGLHCAGIIGCRPQERLRPQSLLLDIKLYFDSTAAANSDDLQQSIDYSDLSKEIQALVADSHCQLIERQAQLIAQFCLQKHPPLLAVRVKLRKPAAIAAADAASIEIYRKN